MTSLPVGTYVVKSELSGFKTVTTKPIQVEAMQIVRIDLTLEVGTVQETVLVAAEAPLLQTETATVGEVISGTTVSTLPLNGRNTGQLSLLLPGVVTPNPSLLRGYRNTGSGGRRTLTATREQTNNYTSTASTIKLTDIDNFVGISPDRTLLGLRFSVETNNYSAARERGRAVISNVSNRARTSSAGTVSSSIATARWTRTRGLNNRSNAPKHRSQPEHFGGTLGGARWSPTGCSSLGVTRALAVRCAGIRDGCGRTGILAPRRPFERGPRPSATPHATRLYRQPDPGGSNQPDCRSDS